jgi:hypothetical protein
MSAGKDVVRMSAAQAEKILANFRDGEQLKAIPAKRTRKLVVFAWLAERFSVGVVYSERDVNALLSLAHTDVATLRRGMYDEFFLDRDDGGYRRTPESAKLVIEPA